MSSEFNDNNENKNDLVNKKNKKNKNCKKNEKWNDINALLNARASLISSDDLFPNYNVAHDDKQTGTLNDVHKHANSHNTYNLPINQQHFFASYVRK